MCHSHADVTWLDNLPVQVSNESMAQAASRPGFGKMYYADRDQLRQPLVRCFS